MRKVSKFPDTRRIEAEACAWIAQLDGGEPSEEDLRAFREWIQRSPHHRQEIRRLSALWGDLNALTELTVPAEKTRRPWFEFPRVRVAACAAVALFGIAILVVVHRPGPEAPPVVIGTDYATVVGERKLVVLVDGSKVLLNTQSQLHVDFSARRRIVRLLKGEAYFEVAHNPDRPFLVYAGANMVRAVGTAFSVHVHKSDIAVVVSEGTVELSSMESGAKDKGPDGAPARMIKLAAITAGQSATIDQNVEAIQTIPPAEVSRKLSWREGVLSFSGEPLEQVVEEVSRYTRVTIVISDPAIRRIAIGGYFKAGETDAMFEALETSFGVRVKRINDRLVYLSAK